MRVCVVVVVVRWFCVFRGYLDVNFEILFSSVVWNRGCDRPIVFKTVIVLILW